jgi:enamine deaminase RidA (YjgF/YER057c/UK114 family)
MRRIAMTTSTSDNEFESQAQALGFDFNGEIKIGGNYAPVILHGHEVYVSGQIPRIGDDVVVTGAVGKDVSLEEAQLAAKICAVRTLALLRNQLGSLSKIKQVLRITVYVNSARHFTQQSEVANSASDTLLRVLGEAGRHTRTSVGVAQLPKGATVELDLIAAV